MKRTIPQFELPLTGSPFNLAGQSAQDGERTQAEIEAVRLARQRAEQLQQFLINELITEQGGEL